MFNMVAFLVVSCRISVGKGVVEAFVAVEISVQPGGGEAMIAS